MKKTVILGASNKPERYSYKALHKLTEHGHPVVLVHPRLTDIEGHTVINDLSDVKEDIDTLTVYVGPKFIGPTIPKIVALKPKRVILNPGTESEELKAALDEANIDYVEACTLVMLSTNQF